MYDRNGLALSPVQTSMTAYKYTAVNTKTRTFTAYAQSTRNRGLYSMVTIAKFPDSRDAAFVGQQFAQLYDEAQVYQMAIDKTFPEVAAEFMRTIEIPEWKFPAEGMDWDDLCGSNGKGAKNRVAGAREALVEAIKISGKPVPNLTIVAKLISQVDALYAEGMGYRDAAKQVIGQLAPQ